MTSHSARRGVPLCVFAGLVSAYALVQVACIASAVLGVALHRERAISAIVIVLILWLLIAFRFRRTGPLPSTPRSDSPHTLAHRIAWGVATAAWLWVVSLWARLWVLA